MATLTLTLQAPMAKGQALPEVPNADVGRGASRRQHGDAGAARASLRGGRDLLLTRYCRLWCEADVLQ